MKIAFGLFVVRFVWSDTRGAKFRRILVNGRSAPCYTARIRRVITLYVYGGDPFVGPLLSVHRVIYRGKPTYRAAPRRAIAIARSLTPVLLAAARISKARVALALSAGSFTTPEFVTNSGASAPDVYYLAEAFRRTSKVYPSLRPYTRFSRDTDVTRLNAAIIWKEMKGKLSLFSYLVRAFSYANGITLKISQSDSRWDVKRPLNRSEKHNNFYQDKSGDWEFVFALSLIRRGPWTRARNVAISES